MVTRIVWRRKQEDVIRQLVLEHANLVLKTIQALYEYISLVLKKRPEKRLREAEQEIAEKVLKLELQADDAEEKIDDELFKSSLLPVTSSSQYDLISAVDGLADRAELIIRKMRIISEPIDLDVKESLSEMAKLCVEATEAVVASVTAMSKDFDEAIKTAHSVYPIREKNRDVEFETLRLLVDHKMECSTFVILHDIIQLLGQTTDKAKDAANIIISMVIKYRA
jgi:uncharacterized protein Yka (UPF0111/DUF47 family)